MTVIGVDDTDSRTRGMCTTYLAARLADRLREGGAAVERLLLVRLNPAVEHKTRGNAALAVHADADPERAAAAARDEVERAAVADDPRTNPGVVVAPGDPDAVPEAVADFAREAVRDHLAIDDARRLADRAGYRAAGWGDGRGRIGALAAVGAWAAFDEWTWEHISYREADRRGTPREVDRDSLFAAADDAYPVAWDTVDRGEDEAVCVPHTPGPILHGVRGDDPDAVRRVAEAVEGEPVERAALFVTNQGTDAHLRNGAVGEVADGRSYRVPGVVASAPETREGGHVFVTLAAPGGSDGGDSDDSGSDDSGSEVSDSDDSSSDASAGDRNRPVDDPEPDEPDQPVGDSNLLDVDPDRTLRCVAFEPTKRFRDRVRALRPGDRVTVCGEVADGTLKLEKFAVRDLVRTERVTPSCPDCGRTMESAGAGQGYRCRDCGTTADGKRTVPVERDLAEGWYEVPPCARRHVAKPLVRGGFDGPVHPER